MNLDLTNQVALITGSSRGIGRSLALAFAGEGAHVAICGRGEEDLKRTAGEIASHGAEVLSVQVDVTTLEGLEQLVDQVRDRWGRIDVLVHNVGGGSGQTLLDTTDADWMNALNLNLLAGVRASRLCVPLMKAQGGGAIVFITSIWGKESGGRITYNPSKAAEISLSKALARELAPDHIRVNCVAPGSILFPGGSWDRRVKSDPEGMNEFVRRELPMGRFGTPEEVANVVVFLCSKKASWVNGACVVVDGCQSKSNI